MATIKLADGRGELYQWDTGRKVVIDDESIKRVHYQNRVYGRTIDVDVSGGFAIIPDRLLQSCSPLVVFAWSGNPDDGYTKIEKTFEVNRRNRPSDYVFTPVDQKTLDDLQEQIGDLADLTTEAKTNLVSAINEVTRTGGSPDAALYTAQTLTDAQKAQARKNIDAASDFVVNATLNLDRTAALDKTFGQMSEALAAGKNPIVHVRLGYENSYLKMSVYTTGLMVFTNIGMQDDGRFALAFALIVTNNGATYRESYLLAADGGQHLPQISMAADPTEDMQIATKKYVDDKECILQSTTAGSTKKFKITVDDSGALSAVEVTE